MNNKTAALFLDFIENNPDERACDLICGQGGYRVTIAAEGVVDTDRIIERANSLYQSTFLEA